MDLDHKSDDEVLKVSSPEETQLSAAEESAIEECLTDPEGSLSGVDLNLFTDSPTNAGKTKKSMEKRREERRHFKFLNTASLSDDEEDSSLSSISTIGSSFNDKQSPPIVNTRKTLGSNEPRLNLRKDNEDHYKSVPSTSHDTNINPHDHTSNGKEMKKTKNLRDLIKERSHSVSLLRSTALRLDKSNLQKLGSTFIATPSSIERSHIVEPIRYNLESWASNRIQSLKEDAGKTPEGEQPMNIELLNIELSQSMHAPLTSKDNIFISNDENAQSRGNLTILNDKPNTKLAVNDVDITENDQASSSRIPSVEKTYFEEKEQMSVKNNKQVETWVQNNFNNKTQLDDLNGLEHEVENKSNDMTTDDEFDNLEQLLKDLKKNDPGVRLERKRNRSHSDRDAFSVSAPKKKMRRRRRSKDPENFSIYSFFSSMADLVSTFSYHSTLTAKSKVTEVLKEIEKELIEWHNDPSPDKPMAEFKMSEEDIKLISKKLAYLPYVY